MVKIDNEDAIWLQVKKELSGEKRDVYIGTCYLSPSKGDGESIREIAKLTENIKFLRSKGEIMMNGDLNAKTGNLDDTITPDKSDKGFGITVGLPPHKRNSQDNVVNACGSEMLDMCKSLDLNIVNGRKTGDLFGNYTCIKWK